MIDESVSSGALFIPPPDATWVWGLFWFKIFLIGSVDGMVKGLQAFPQTDFTCFQQSGTVEDVLQISHKAGLP
jgi:hypothetical protein